MVKAPFEFIRHADPRQVLNFLSAEHPQTIAVALADMIPDDAVHGPRWTRRGAAA